MQLAKDIWHFSLCMSWRSLWNVALAVFGSNLLNDNNVEHFFKDLKVIYPG